MTTHSLLLCSCILLLALAAIPLEAADSQLYEMRTYYAPEGKLDALHSRFRDHTTRLFEKHGMTNIGYWVPIDNPDRKLIYVLAYPSREARDKSWKAFAADDAWKQIKAKTEANGAIVSKVESAFLVATDYSPEIEPASSGDRIFELRTYTTTPGNLDRLHARFRNHTIKLFARHGITNIAYWSLAPQQEQADKTLIYIVAHKSVDAAKASFDAFRKDPEWLSAREASEKDAGGSLTAVNGVQSLYLKATDYSPMK